LPDGGSKTDGEDEPTLHARLKRKAEPYDAYREELPPPSLTPPSAKIKDTFGALFFTRMLYSALVDADYLDTEAFMRSDSAAKRGGGSSVEELCGRLNSETEKYLNPTEPVSELYRRRTALLRNCLDASQSGKGLFTLTAPTGSGKTIASLAFALQHAAKHSMRRVIFVVPYNTIIEQNSKVFEDILGAENVLRHHSNANYDGDENENDAKRFAAENWDYPVIVTSSVQFFESLFAAKPGKCRKLHNIAESVIIFDEAQMIPQPYLLPCVRAIRELAEVYGATAVLATATQSSLDRYFAPLSPQEITENPGELYEFLRRVTLVRIDEPLTGSELTGRLRGHKQVLCIVNTRRQAQRIFAGLAENTESGGTFHLSTTMYPEHRTRVLAKIRCLLRNGKPCRVVSTSMVEAGVDLDFPTVFREEAGLDSIVQAAGRCNREGGRPPDESFVYIFKSADHNPPRAMAAAIGAFEQTARRYADLSSLDAVAAFFEQLFYNKGDGALDAEEILKKIERSGKSFSFPFREIADSVKIIDDDSVSLYVLRDAPELETRFRKGERTRELFRAAGGEAYII
ncbi:MAG: CRISPR-associated helicase Cas3', partial [Oscillospiraceae bacterium]|jgi:CRISPR-associated endonuclease/helicase Cas3|nr:CRISPR-associated helicase Cas3' [Oscillospiraceae bacterium]